MDGPQHFPPHRDPIEVCRERADWPVYFDENTILPVNAEKTETKNRVVLPFFAQRIREMAEDGFPFPLDRIDEMIELATIIKISDFHKKERASRKKESETAIYRPEFFRIVSDGHEDFHRGLEARPRTLIHELVHVISGHRMPSEYFNVHEQSPTHNIVNLDAKNALLLEALRPEMRSRHDLFADLDEAMTETLSRWIVSDLRPDFGDMTCREFFRGPSDVKYSAYFEESYFFERVLGDMPLAPLARFCFTDYTSLDPPGERTPSYQAFANTLGRHIKGGITGLTQLSEIDNQLPVLLFIPPEVLTTKWKLLRAASSKKKKLVAYLDTVSTMTTGWRKEQQAFEEEFGTCEIAQANSSNARLVTEVPTISPEAKEKRDAGIAQAREVYPLRVRTPNTPPSTTRLDRGTEIQSPDR